MIPQMAVDMMEMDLNYIMVIEHNPSPFVFVEDLTEWRAGGTVAVFQCDGCGETFGGVLPIGVVSYVACPDCGYENGSRVVVQGPGDGTWL